MQESDIESYLRRKAKEQGAMPMKFVSPGLRGVPDRCLAFPGGLMVFVELKAPGEKPRKQQEYRMQQLRNRGFIVKVIDDRSGVDQLIEEVRTWNSKRTTTSNMP